MKNFQVGKLMKEVSETDWLITFISSTILTGYGTAEAIVNFGKIARNYITAV